MAVLEGIVKINSKILEPSELKKFDKLEKEGISGNGLVLKGKLEFLRIWNYKQRKSEKVKAESQIFETLRSFLFYE